MALIIQCVNGHKMSVQPEYAGKRVRCPQCQEVVTVPTPSGPLPAPPAPMPPPIPEEGRYAEGRPGMSAPAGRNFDHADDHYDEPRAERPRPRDWDDRENESARRRDDRDYDRDSIDYVLNADEVGQLQTVSIGLIFVGWRYLLWIFVYVILAVILTVALIVEEFARMRGRGAEVWMVMMGILGIICVLIFLVLLIFTFIGSGMCCRAPQRSGAKGLIAGSLICDGVVIFGIVVFFVLAMVASSMRGGGEFLGFIAVAIMILGVIAWISGQILLHLFLHRMSHFTHDPRLASSAMSNLVLWLIFFVGIPLIGAALLIVLAASRARSETVAVVALPLAWVYVLSMVLVYSLLSSVIFRLRRRIAAELHGNTR